MSSSLIDSNALDSLVAGSYVTSRIGSSLVSLNYDRLQKEANFRFNLIRTRFDHNLLVSID